MQTVVKAGAVGELTADLSSTNAAHDSVYGFEVSVTKTFEEDYFGMLSLPAFLVTDHERVYAFTFWAKATGNPKPRPHVTFQAGREAGRHYWRRHARERVSVIGRWKRMHARVRCLCCVPESGSDDMWVWLQGWMGCRNLLAARGKGIGCAQRRRP